MRSEGTRGLDLALRWSCLTGKGFRFDRVGWPTLYSSSPCSGADGCQTCLPLILWRRAVASETCGVSLRVIVELQAHWDYFSSLKLPFSPRGYTLTLFPLNDSFDLDCLCYLALSDLSQAMKQWMSPSVRGFQVLISLCY